MGPPASLYDLPFTRYVIPFDFNNITLAYITDLSICRLQYIDHTCLISPNLSDRCAGGLGLHEAHTLAGRIR